MSGHAARLGFRYQDLYLLLRVLQDASAYLDKAWNTGLPNGAGLLDGSPTRYGIEASLRTQGPADGTTVAGPDWDVLVSHDDTLEFAEVKSGTISKDDRLAFWRRLRRELASSSSHVKAVVPILVVDPDKAGELGKWEELATAAAASSGRAPSDEPIDNGVTADHLLVEALWHLCRPNAPRDDNDRALAPEEARLLLRVCVKTSPDLRRVNLTVWQECDRGGHCGES